MGLGGRFFSTLLLILANWSAFDAISLALMLENCSLIHCSVLASHSERDLHNKHLRVSCSLRFSRFSNYVACTWRTS